MPGLGTRLLGAAVAGAGAGILQQAQTRREEALLRLRRDWQVQDREALWAREDAKAAAAPPPAPTTATDIHGRHRIVAPGTPEHGTLLFSDVGEAPAPPPTTEQQNIAAYLAANPGKTMDDYFAAKRTGGVTVQTGDTAPAQPMSAVYDPQTRLKPSKDHVFDFNPQTGTIRRDERGLPIEVPRGKAATKAEELAEKAAGREESTKRQASLATTHIDAIKGILKDSPSTTTGIAGAFLSQIPSTSAHDLDRRIDTLKAMIGFNALNEMRANSPTGGALGNVTERELALLQSTVASLELSQSRDQFLENLALVEEQFNRVVHGPEGGGGAAPGEDPNLEPAPNVALPPPERVEPISAPAPASMSAPRPELPGPQGTVATGRFADMSIDDLATVDAAALSSEEFDAFMARLAELEGG